MASSSSSHVRRKVEHVLSPAARSKVESAEIVESLKGLSGVISSRTKNTHRLRAGLRTMLQQRTVQNNRLLVEAFAPVQDELRKLQETVATLSVDCTALNERLAATRARTSSLMSESRALTDERDEVQAKHALVTDFLGKFQLTAHETAILEGGDDDELTHEFFDTLARASHIRDGCRELVRGSQQLRVGLDILDQLSKQIERAYERMYLWVQKQARRATADASSDPDPVLVRAMRLLSTNPAFYEHCQQEIVQARRVQLIRRFVTALTRGSKTARPIEIHAHDSVRYVSDMLAWLHQAGAGEREFFGQLFDDDSDNGEKKKKEREDGDAEARRLGLVMEGVVRPLKTRVEQAIVAQTDPVGSFQLENVLGFYVQQLSSLVGSKAKLGEALVALRRVASQHFFSQVQGELDFLVAHPPPYAQDLAPPRAVRDLLDTLHQLMVVFSSSLVAAHQRETDFAPVLAAIVDPLLDQVVPAIAGDELDATDLAVLELNVLDSAERVLKKFTFAQTRRETLSLRVFELVRRLVEQDDAHFRRCGIKEDGTVDTERLLNGVLLFMPFDRIRNQDVRAQVCEQTAKRVCDKYEAVYTERQGVGLEYRPEHVRKVLER